MPDSFTVNMKNPILPDMSDVFHLMSDVWGENVGQIVRHLSFVFTDKNVTEKRLVEYRPREITRNCF